jgi:hypothetical protein
MTEWEKGSGLIELMMVMALLILFGFTIYSLIYAGSGTMKNIEADKEAQINARIAHSYLNVRLRQNDGQDQILVRENAINDQNAIILRYHDPDDPDFDYDVWIFWEDGVLREVLADPDAAPDWLGANDIVAIDSFDAVMDADGALKHTISYLYHGETQTLSSVFAPRGDRGNRRGDRLSEGAAS